MIITGRRGGGGGGLDKNGMGVVNFYPYEKGGVGGGKRFSHAEGGGGGGETKNVRPLKGAVQEFVPCLVGVVQKVSDLLYSNFVAPLPVINDQSIFS